MAIPSSMLKSIYVAYPLGMDADGKVAYITPIEIQAQVSDIRSVVLRENVGFVPDYDRYIYVPIGEKTEYINEQTLLWVDVEPNAKGNNMDYKIERVGDIIDNNITLYCNSLTPNTKSLYYEHNGKIYQIKVDLDNDSLVALVPHNKYFPITLHNKVWLTKPTSLDSTTNLIRLMRVEKLEKSRKFVFEKVF